MRRMAIVLLLVAAVVGVSAAQEKQVISVETMPPSVVKTVPQAGDTAVDAGLKEIRVTFSKEMITERMWSVVRINRENFPRIVGQVHYLKDKRTFVAPVALEPGKTYTLWFNRGRYTGFRDKQKNPAVPYLLVFQTKK